MTEPNLHQAQVVLDDCLTLADAKTQLVGIAEIETMQRRGKVTVRVYLHHKGGRVEVFNCDTTNDNVYDILLIDLLRVFRPGEWVNRIHNAALAAPKTGDSQFSAIDDNAMWK